MVEKGNNVIVATPVERLGLREKKKCIIRFCFRGYLIIRQTLGSNFMTNNADREKQRVV